MISHIFTCQKREVLRKSRAKNVISGSKQYVIEDKWAAVEKEKMRNIKRLAEASKILLVAEVLAKKGKKEVSFGIDCATRVEKSELFR